MKKTIVLALVLCVFLSCAAAAFAEGPAVQKNAVTELYSMDGVYTDSVGNTESYSFHVPQLNADTEDARAINQAIAERFGAVVDYQLENMAKGYSLWCWQAQWHAYWNRGRLFLLVSVREEGDSTDYAAYGYDFEAGCRVDNAAILKELGVSEEEYLKSLREKVQFMFEDMYGSLTEQQREQVGYDEMLEKTLGWVSMEQPMFYDGMGEIETIVKIASIAGAEWYYHLATPFVYG